MLGLFGLGISVCPSIAHIPEPVSFLHCTSCIVSLICFNPAAYIAGDTLILIRQH